MATPPSCGMPPAVGPAPLDSFAPAAPLTPPSSPAPLARSAQRAARCPATAALGGAAAARAQWTPPWMHLTRARRASSAPEISPAPCPTCPAATAPLTPMPSTTPGAPHPSRAPVHLQASRSALPMASLAPPLSRWCPAQPGATSPASWHPPLPPACPAPLARTVLMKAGLIRCVLAAALLASMAPKWGPLRRPRPAQSAARAPTPP